MSAAGPDYPSCDAIVVGARCAGAATALLMARAGARVLLVDRGRYGTDTLSTHALMRGGVVQLHRWGVLPAVIEAGTPPVRKASFHYGPEILSFPIKPRDGVDALYAPRRAVLDRLLVDAARDAGAEVVYETRITDLLRSDGGRIQGALLTDNDGHTRSVRAGLVVGADGLRSTVARLAGGEIYEAGQHATGVVYAYWSGLDLDEYRWCFGPGVAVGAIPTNDGQACIFAAVPAARFSAEIRHDIEAGYQRVIAECSPELAASLRSSERAGPFHGFPGQAGFFRNSKGPGWALVGDAGYFKDPLTAHGITDAFRDAELLAAAASVGTGTAMAGYQQARDEAARDVFDVTDEIASFDWDMETIKVKHQRLNEAMAREARAMASPAPPPPAGMQSALR